VSEHFVGKGRDGVGLGPSREKGEEASAEGREDVCSDSQEFRRSAPADVCHAILSADVCHAILRS
jgi:hypothetical protein